MESILSTIFSTENVRTLATLVSIFSCFVWLKTSLEKKIGGVEASIKSELVATNKRIDGVETSVNELRITLNGKIDELRGTMDNRINELKYNDFAHLSSAFEALTYVLEKNGSMKKEDKEYVDSRLAH